VHTHDLSNCLAQRLKKRYVVLSSFHTRYPHAIAMPSSRGGRSEAQQNPPRCANAQLRRRVGNCGSKAHSTLHSLFYTYVYKILRKVTLVTLLLGPAKTPLCPNVRFPTRNHCPGCHIAVLPRRQRVWAWAADAHLGSPVGTFFGHKASRCACTVAVQPLCRHFAPKVGPKTPQGGPTGATKESKSSFLGASGTTFRSQIGESGPL